MDAMLVPGRKECIQNDNITVVIYDTGKINGFREMK
jgi:hypothetical protein